MISFISVLTGAVLVALAAPFGILWYSMTLLVRHLGSLDWMTATQRSDAARPVRTYLTGLATPILLILTGTPARRWIFGDAATGHGILQKFLMLARSVAAGAIVGASYFACYFSQQLRGYYVIQRGRLAVSA